MSPARPPADRLPPAGERDGDPGREPDGAAAAADGPAGRHRAGHRHLGIDAVQGGAPVGQGGGAPVHRRPGAQRVDGPGLVLQAPVVRAGFTQDAAALGAAIDALAAVGETALWDASPLAAHLYDAAARSPAQPGAALRRGRLHQHRHRKQAVAAIRPPTPPSSPSGSPPTSSTPPVSPAWSVRPAARPARAATRPTSPPSSPRSVRPSRTSTRSPTGRRPAANRWPSTSRPAAAPCRSQTRAGTVGSVASPKAVARPDGLMTSAGGKGVLLLLAALAAGFLAFALLLIFGRQGRHPRQPARVLRRRGPALDDDPASAGASAGATFIESSLVQRAVGLTSKMAGSRRPAGQGGARSWSRPTCRCGPPRRCSSTAPA